MDSSNRVVYRVSIVVDYDGDGRDDVVDLVENPTRAGVRVRFGGARPPAPAIVYSMSGRWAQEQLFAAGRRRIYLVRPELGYTLLLRRGRRDLAYQAGL